ncbi:MAG: cytochrome c [Alphaproteobacteria bacterium]|nr:cytochrome c [Alphaproteobacteria bacterium]
MKGILFTAALSIIPISLACADEPIVPLIDAPGRGAVVNNCASCHSLDYPRINAPFMNRKMWQAEIDKMINVFGAPIDPGDAAVIADYLVKHYGAAE